MTWTDLSGAFGYGTKLTSQQQGELRDNATHCYDFFESMGEGQLLVGQSSAESLAKDISNDITISQAGAATIAALAVTGAKTSKTITVAGYWTLPGFTTYLPVTAIYMLSPEVANVVLQLYVTDAFYGSGYISGVYNMDGTNQRIYNSLSTSRKVYHHVL
jgi:hypothetical protein